MLVSVVNTQDQITVTTNRMAMPPLQGVGDIDMLQSDSGIVTPALPRDVTNFIILLAHALLNI